MISFEDGDWDVSLNEDVIVMLGDYIFSLKPEQAIDIGAALISYGSDAMEDE